MFSKGQVLISISIAAAIAFLGHPPAIAEGPRRDCSTAATALKLNPQLCDGKFQADYKTLLVKGENSQVLRKLGIALRRLGYLDEAQSALERSLQLKPSNDTRLSLANAIQAKFRRAVSEIDPDGEIVTNLDLLDKTNALANLALSEYQTVYQSDPSQLEAQLNWLNLWSRLSATNELQQIQDKNLTSAHAVLSNIQIQSLPIDSRIETRIKIAEALIKVKNLDKSFNIIALESATKALSDSKKTGNLRQISKSSGAIATLLLQQDKTDAALKSFNKAHSAAQSIRAYDLLYQWQWGLARLYAKQGNREKAEALYADTIACIEKVRGDMLSLQSGLQYSFRDDIEPVYREYLALLLSSDSPNLSKVIKTNEQLQIGEIENYLQCGSLGIKSLLSLSPKQSPEATLSFVKLPNQYGIVVRNKNGKMHLHVIKRQPIDSQVRKIKIYLQGNRFSENATSNEFRESFSSLYNQLIKPISQYLPESGNLAFSIDSNLQSIPWGLLYDGQKYLIEQYSISLSLGTELLPPKSLRENPTALFAGTTEFPKNSNFSSLPSIKNEINSIASNLKGKILLNQNFTNENLLRFGSQVQILHLATHGQFSSQANNTFILNWDGKFTLSNLQQLLQDRENNPLELLVLSACKTAAGDRRATLGLAGTAFQAGARSTVASLWVVEDDSQTLLMQEFYTQLIKERKPKAEALRLAQLKLLRSGKYSSPYFWSGTLLLGSWL
jgi:CHAT domain-containing protein/Tfp pilus assembly protein PilF